MAIPFKRPPRPARYYLGFGFTALILAGLTLVLVLVVLPRRYVLSAGLRESGVSFPSEAAPFTPPEERFTEAPPPPPPTPGIVKGPAEIFWGEVDPLLEQGRYRQALPIFEGYLDAHPDDLGALKEYAITLQRDGAHADALLVFDNLLSAENDPEVRLLLARGLRDGKRMNEASVHYGILLAANPEDTSLALEWGKALAWEKEYQRGAEVLSQGLVVDPASVDLRIALAQVYYWSGKLDEANAVLSALDEGTLQVSGGVALKREIVAALTPPEPDPEEIPIPGTPLSLEEKIALAQAEEDFQEASRLYREVLQEAPGDTASLRAYADLLQFSLDDLEGARAALLSLEALGAGNAAMKFRLAQLDIWTGRNEEAAGRLQTLLAELEVRADRPRGAPEADVSFGPARVAEVRALLGDLRRWEGDRSLSGDTYRTALLGDPGNARAREGLEELEAEAKGEIEELETPGFGGNAYSISDTDDFFRLDLGLDGKSIQDHWVWGFRAGNRWLGGFDLSGQSSEDRGPFLEVESARWWRWGTLRTGLHFGLEEVRPGVTDISFGGTLRFSDLGGFRTDLRFDHGPAYPLTMTLQSVLGDVVQDRITANLSRAAGRRWSLSLAGDAARLQSGNVNGSGQPGSLRLEAGASLGRSMTDQFILGINARAAGYSEASPVLNDMRLFWDPKAVLAGGLYAQWNQNLAESWIVRARLNPSLAFIDERTARGFEAVPHLSADAGVSYRTRRFRTNLDAFYYQGRFDGYRAYGLRLSVNARDWFRKEDG